MKKLNTRGGKREGAGRKPSPHGPAKVIRVPLKYIPRIKNLLSIWKTEDLRE